MTAPAPVAQSTFYQLPREAQLARARAKLPGAAFQLLNYIESRRFNAKKAQYITPTNGELAAELGCDERTITRSLARLDKDGFTRTIAQTTTSVRRIYLSTAAGAAMPESKKLPTVGPAGLVATRETMAEVRAGQHMLHFDSTSSNVIQLPFHSLKTRTDDVEGVDKNVHPLDKIVHPPDTQTQPKPSAENTLVFEVENPKTYTTETTLKTTAVVPAAAPPLFDPPDLLKQKRQASEFQQQVNRDKRQRECKAPSALGDLLSGLITASDTEALFQRLGKTCEANGLSSDQVRDVLKIVRQVAPKLETGYAWRVLAWVCQIRRQRGRGKFFPSPVGFVKSMVSKGIEPNDCDLRAAKAEWER